MRRLVITDHTFPNLDQEATTAEAIGATLDVHQAHTEEAALAALSGADLALVNFAPITRRVLEAMAPEATIVRYGVGYDNIDITAATELGISICHVPHYGTDTVADHTVTLILLMLRRVPQQQHAIALGHWPSPADTGPIHASPQTTIGLLGTGRIGRAVARRLTPFGFSILACDPAGDPRELAAEHITLVDQQTLLQQSDVLSLHAPLTDRTRQIVNDTTLAQMRPDAILVNTARGGLVDINAMLTALDTGQLGGAALDVVEPEPLPEDHPIRRHPHVVLTAHTAFYSIESLRELQRLASEEIARVAMGEAPRCLVPSTR